MNNPKAGNGDRNFWCDAYGQCLDTAVKFDWDSFNCESCPLFRMIKDPLFDSREEKHKSPNPLITTFKSREEYKEVISNNIDHVDLKIFLFVKLDGKVHYKKFRSGYSVDKEMLPELTGRLGFLRRDKLKQIRTMFDLLKNIQGIFKNRF